MKLHEDEHSVISISDVGNNIYVGSHKRNVKTMIVNSSNTLSLGESGERTNVARSYLATIQNNSKNTKSNRNVIEMFCIWKKKGDIAQIENFLHVRRIGFQKKLSYSLSFHKV